MSWMIPLIGSMVKKAILTLNIYPISTQFFNLLFSFKNGSSSSLGIFGENKFTSLKTTNHQPLPLRPRSSSIGRCSIFKSSLNDRASPHAAARKTSSWPPEIHPFRSIRLPFVFPVAEKKRKPLGFQWFCGWPGWTLFFSHGSVENGWNFEGLLWLEIHPFVTEPWRFGRNRVLNHLPQEMRW